MEPSHCPHKEKWMREQRVISIFGNEALRDPRLDLTLAKSPSNKYERLALRRFAEFLNKLETSPKGSEEDQNMRSHLSKAPLIEHGYLVMGRIISHAVKAYFNYCRRNSCEPSLEELSKLLKSDQAFYDLVFFIADMPGDMNKEYEYAYSLVSGGFENSGDNTPYFVDKRSDGMIIIYPYDELESQASLCSQGIMHDPNKNHEFASCPAKNVFLRKLWDNMMDACESDPELFPAEFNS